MFSLLTLEMAKSIQGDRLRDAERRRTAAKARGRGREDASQIASVPAPVQPVTPPVEALAALAGTSDAVRSGRIIEVGATAAAGPDGRILFPGDAYLQTREALRAVGDSLEAFGAGLEDVVRTRVFLKKTWQWEDAGRAHGEVFKETRPVTTFVGAGGFVDSSMLVAVEATAVVDA